MVRHVDPTVKWILLIAVSASVSTGAHAMSLEALAETKPHSEASLLVGDTKLAALTLNVEGASCASCSFTLRRALKVLKGVEDIREGAHKKQVIIDFNPTLVTSGSIVEAINKTALKATPVHLE